MPAPIPTATSIIFLAPGATTGDKQTFGMVVAHELSHQWFGDLVTPAWWDDIWLNESFANWMGYRIGNEWRPELKIGVGALDEGFSAMNTDALLVGRPIHQPINDNSEIDSAFDNITYGKGGQVVAMIAAYLGDEKFKEGVRLHLKRHAYGNATSEQFFQSIADAAKDAEVLAAFKSFVDQPGVPLVSLRRDGSKAGRDAIALRLPRHAGRRRRAGRFRSASARARPRIACCSTRRRPRSMRRAMARSCPTSAAPATIASTCRRRTGTR